VVDPSQLLGGGENLDLLADCLKDVHILKLRDLGKQPEPLDAEFKLEAQLDSLSEAFLQAFLEAFPETLTEAFSVTLLTTPSKTLLFPPLGPLLNTLCQHGVHLLKISKLRQFDAREPAGFGHRKRSPTVT